MDKNKSEGQISAKELLWLMLIAPKLDTCETKVDLRAVINTATAMVEELMELPLHVLSPTSQTYMKCIFDDALKEGGNHDR
jgi:hypothetical protein